MPDLEIDPAADSAATPCPRACLLCHREFFPNKPNQTYHSPACRRKALRLRQRADELCEERGQPRLNATRLWHAQQAQRLRAEHPSLRKHPYLHAHAELIEAEAQVRRWQKLARERTARLARLEPPKLDVQVHLLEPGGEVLPLDLQKTHGAIVSTDGSLAVALLGRELSAG